jgi:hypothetical protein
MKFLFFLILITFTLSRLRRKSHTGEPTVKFIPPVHDNSKLWAMFFKPVAVVLVENEQNEPKEQRFEPVSVMIDVEKQNSKEQIKFSFGENKDLLAQLPAVYKLLENDKHAHIHLDFSKFDMSVKSNSKLEIPLKVLGLKINIVLEFDNEIDDDLLDILDQYMLRSLIESIDELLLNHPSPTIPQVLPITIKTKKIRDHDSPDIVRLFADFSKRGETLATKLRNLQNKLVEIQQEPESNE